MPLSQRSIDAVFARMLVRYGAQWLRMWDGVPMEAVKTDWARELDGLDRNPRAIQYALEHLPADFPPNVTQFKTLCINRPDPETKRLPAPKANPARVKAELERMKSLQREVSPSQWARDLQAKEKSGGDVTEAERAMWRAGLRSAPEPGLLIFNTIPEESLPPGMRSRS